MALLLVLAGCAQQLPRSAHSPAPTAPPPAGGDAFADITASTGVDFVHSLGDGKFDNLVKGSGGGVALLDFDQDGWLDIYFVNGGWHPDLCTGPAPRPLPTNHLYRNDGHGHFTDVTRPAGVGDTGFGMGVAAGDYDNDGFPDLYVTNYGPDVLYHNDRNGTFTDVTAAAGVGDPRCGVGATWLDYDRDGWLDVYVGNYIEFDPAYRAFYAPDGFPGPTSYAGVRDTLYRNLGNGRFADVTEAVGLAQFAGRTMGLVAVDANDDGFPDLYVANDKMPNSLFLNEAGKRFRDAAGSAGVAMNHLGDATGSMAVDFGDVDGDGRLDLYVSDNSFGSLFVNAGDGRFVDRVMASGLGAPSAQYVGWGAFFFDYDNDGDLDLFKANGDLSRLFGQEDQLFANDGAGRFTDVSRDAGPHFARALMGRGACTGDLDNDGDQDLVIVNLNSPAVVLRNDAGAQQHWLLLRLRGRASNADGVGARIRARIAGRTVVTEKRSASGYLSQSDPRVHLGLGAATQVDELEIRWPSGRVQTLKAVPADQILEVEEPDA